MNSIPGWTIKIDEISNGVFKVTLTDSYGRKVEIIDDATDETIERAISDAFEIEKQISDNWSKYLYDFCLSRLKNIDLTKKEYQREDFGSWYVELKNKRIVYDGKDFWLIYEEKNNGDWEDKIIIKRKELDYKNFIYLVDLLKVQHYAARFFRIAVLRIRLRWAALRQLAKRYMK